MSDSGEKKRPNANYRLSYENTEPDELVFHYSRERRLAKAPQAVRDLYAPEAPRRFRLFSSLVNTKPKMMLFFTIIVMCIITTVISRLGNAGGRHTIDGNQLAVQAVRYEGATMIALAKTVPSKGAGRLSRAEPYTGAVDIAVQPSAKNGGVQSGAIFYHKIFFTYDSSENFRFSVPFDAEELAIVLKTEKKTLGLTLKTQ